MEKTKIYNFRLWIEITEHQEMIVPLEEMLREAQYGIVGFSEHHFSPQGYTCTWLLSESHCALHTFPEEGRSYIELSGCSETKSQHFIEALKARWKGYISGSEQSQI